MIINFSNIGSGSGSGSSGMTSGQVETQILSHNYVTSAQVETQITNKNYLTSADTENFATSSELSALTSHIEESEEVISTALNDINGRLSGGTGGGSSIEYVNNLNFSGETGKIYVYNDKEYIWSTTSGYVGEVIGYRDSRTTSNCYICFDYYPSSLDGKLVFSFQYFSETTNSKYLYLDLQNERLLVYSTAQTNPLTGTPDTTISRNGNYVQLFVKYTSVNLKVRWVDNCIRIYEVHSSITFSGRISMLVTEPHFELLNYQYADRQIDVIGTSNDIGSGVTSGVPFWDEKGNILNKNYDIEEGEVTVNYSNLYTSSKKAVYLKKAGATTFPRKMYVAEEGGADGTILKSNGVDAAPTFVSLSTLMGGITIVKCTQSEYENMATHDANTLYIIEEE